LIAIMVVVRKLIVTDIKDIPLEVLLHLSTLPIVLGLLCFLLGRESKQASD